jgi:type II secretory pathway pseudopilin PulG
MRTVSKRFAFTLLELMVAVVVLLAVMVAIGRIFSTVINVSATGIAIGDTLQQATAIEQQLREDMSKVSHDGFFAIKHTAVPNDLNGYVLLDESQPAEAVLRFDQLVFLRLGSATPTGINPNNVMDFVGQTLASKVYYGHGVSFSTLTSYKDGTVLYSQDPVLLGDEIGDQVITPWNQGAVEYQERMYTGSQSSNFDLTGNTGTASGTQPNSKKWMLVRQGISLGDDDDNDRVGTSKKAYAQAGIATHSIFPSDPRFTLCDPSNIYPHVLNGRVDIVSTHLGDLRNSVTNEVEVGDGTGGRWWKMMNNDAQLDQQELIASLLQWPRVEPEPSSTYRQELMLLKSAIAQGCVSFQIEWAYDEGVGGTTDINGVPYPGYEYPTSQPRPWWGGSYRDTNGEIFFETLEDYHSQSISYQDWLDGNYDVTTDSVAAESVNASFIERYFVNGEGPSSSLIPVVADGSIKEYWTIFGYNTNEPFAENQIDLLNNGFMYFDNRYTPRPSALKITLRLVDRSGDLGSGWVYQFVVDLPEVHK